jgi:hypothetical protein
MGKGEVVEMYREYIMNKPELLQLIPIELKDNALGYWCKPEACDGDGGCNRHWCSYGRLNF